MSHPLFLELLEGFARLSKIENAGLFLKDRVVKVDGVTFSLIYDEQVADIVFIYVDFGDLPSDRALEICRALLEANMFLFASKQQISFVISPDTKNVTLACRVELSKLTPTKLRTLLADLSAKARQWRNNFFFDLKPIPSAPGSESFQSRNLAFLKKGGRATRSRS